MIALNLLYTESFLLRHNKVYAIIGSDDFDMRFVQSLSCTRCTYNQRSSRLKHKARTPSVLFSRSLFVHLPIVLSVLLRFTDSDYPLVSFAHCVICSSSTYGFWLPLWYPLPIVLSVLLRLTDSDYPFGIFILFFLYLLYISMLCKSLVSILCSYLLHWSKKNQYLGRLWL